MNGELQRYFSRINYTCSLQPTLANMRQITWLHQLAIPFENLDIVLFNRPISLETPDIFAKLVDQGRGGFCFEQNGLLGLVLGWMGYSVSYGYATWLSDDGEEIDPFSLLRGRQNHGGRRQTDCDPKWRAGRTSIRQQARRTCSAQRMVWYRSN
ncbi:hypothetical protein BH24CHL4_BH24CHL4_08400 [soil metagenome]